MLSSVCLHNPYFAHRIICHGAITYIFTSRRAEIAYKRILLSELTCDGQLSFSYLLEKLTYLYSWVQYTAFLLACISAYVSLETVVGTLTAFLHCPLNVTEAIVDSTLRPRRTEPPGEHAGI